MTKGLDDSLDITKAALQYILFIFQSDSPLSVKIANQYLQSLLRDTTTITSQTYIKLASIDFRPKIILKKRCNRPLLSSFVPYNGDQNYPAFSSQNSQQIVVCLESIKNKIELKENIDRQLVTVYELNKNRIQQTNSNEDKAAKADKMNNLDDRKLMKALYVGCLYGYRNYLLPTQQTNKLAKKCAGYLFRRRSQSNLPHDSLFRYAGKLADQICL